MQHIYIHMLLRVYIYIYIYIRIHIEVMCMSIIHMNIHSIMNQVCDCFLPNSLIIGLRLKLLVCNRFAF